MKKYVIMLFWILLLFLVSCVSTESVFSQATIVTDAQNQELAQEIETIEIKETEVAEPIVNLLPDESAYPEQYNSYGYDISPQDIYYMADCFYNTNEFQNLESLNAAYRLYGSINAIKSFALIDNIYINSDVSKKWSKCLSGIKITKKEYEYLSNSPSLITEKLLNSWNVYKVGDIGPAGGYIFYDKGNYSDGWRYLEAAPNPLEKRYIFGTTAYPVNSSATGIGFGKVNTLNLSKVYHRYDKKRWIPAVDACLDYSVNEYNDWFLPSLSELVAFLKSFTNNKFLKKSCWSSSEYNEDHAWAAYIDENGEVVTVYRTKYDQYYYVWPVRTF